MHYDKNEYAELFEKFIGEDRIKKSFETFKIKLFLEKSESSLYIANHHINFEPTKDEPSKLHWNYWAITISYYSMLYAAKAAILSKGYEVSDHYSAQISLGHLLIPDKIEKEDLELLDQAYKIFEDEYIRFFEDARIESHNARYLALKKYTEKRVEEIFENARKFVAKIRIILN